MNIHQANSWKHTNTKSFLIFSWRFEGIKQTANERREQHLLKKRQGDNWDQYCYYGRLRHTSQYSIWSILHCAVLITSEWTQFKEHLLVNVSVLVLKIIIPLLLLLYYYVITVIKFIQTSCWKDLLNTPASQLVTAHITSSCQSNKSPTNQILYSSLAFPSCLVEVTRLIWFCQSPTTICRCFDWMMWRSSARNEIWPESPLLTLQNSCYIFLIKDLQWYSISASVQSERWLVKKCFHDSFLQNKWCL